MRDHPLPGPGAVFPLRTGNDLLRRTLRRHRARLAGACALISVWQVCEALVPVAIGIVIDRVVATGDLPGLGVAVLGMAVLFAVLSFSYRFGARLSWRVLQTETHRIRTEIADLVLSPDGLRTDRKPGEVLSLATGDAELSTYVVRQLAQAFAAICGLVVAVVLLLRIDLVLGLVVAVGTPLVLLTTRWLAPALSRRTAEAQEKIAGVSGLATDLVAGLRPLKGIGAERTAVRRYRAASREAAAAGVSTARSQGLLYGVTGSASLVFLAVVTLLAGLAAVDGRLSIGELIAVIGLAQFLAEPLQQAAGTISALAGSRAAADRLVTFLNCPPLETHGAAGLPDRAGPAELRLDEVVAGPLRGLDLHAAPGEFVAVVADDPAVAGAVLGLLQGAQLPQDGAASLAGIPIGDLASTTLRSQLLVCPHRVDLFEGTLLDNVDPAGDLTAERLEQVLVASAADDVVALQPEGLQAHVAANGVTLSGGQQQRIALARALAADRPVLVLDDPTTAVDAVTEVRIAEGIVRHRHSGPDRRTTVVLTTSPALLARADRVVVVRDGRAVSVGVHADLVHDADYAGAVLR
ncbi:ATP-binding cassette domain-containing protein [Nakamurella sp. YIM 132087]|uniref:ATP-binding cassette domain-containing protein n=1 Tax=Nakamurella alba TaxID=2665158 RepID=A0A7K1FNJ5_9ACTN|nr:ABC transporter ATP-binding protein [Nakamurella alba]MTD15735.1 ATP-binding cassette domain-containing protein [Nakamurella alba]